MTLENLSEQIKDAIGSHGMWTLRLKTAIKVGKSDLDPKDVRCDDGCDFGRWLHSDEIDESTRSGSPYKVIRRLHSEFHECAADVLELATDGRAPEATVLLEGAFSNQSQKLVRGLRKWKGEVN